MAEPGYVLEQQVGFMLRRANQRHLGIFAARMPGLTAMQFAALARLCAGGTMSQNALGRAVAMDGATIKGVVDRLRAKGLIDATRDPGDRRRVVLAPSTAGRLLYDAVERSAAQISAETLAPLSGTEQRQFLALLARLG